MSSTRISRNALCLAAAVLLCGAPVYGQNGSMGGQSGTTGSGMPNGNTGQPSSGAYPGNSQSGSMASDPNSGAGNMQDKDFVKTALEGGMAEIQLAQLAQQKASNDQVKQFAQKMIDDHTKMGDQMKPIAQQMGITPPANLSKKHQAVQKRLEGLSGDQFDKEYVKAMVADHREDNKDFMMEESRAQDPALKEVVTQAAPIIAEHLKMAESLQKGNMSSM